MGRLFWKFFFAFWLCLLAAGVGVGTVVRIFLHDENRFAELRRERAALRAGQEGTPQAPPPTTTGWNRRRARTWAWLHPPLVLTASGLLASVACSALLAWYLAKPIRSLSWAFDAVARGRLDTRVAPRMGARRDEMADLGAGFDRMTAQLELLLNAQRRLLDDVSHELRSPLARLQAAVGLARQSPEKLGSSLDRIEREAERLDGLVGELLTLSHLEAGTAGERREKEDLVELAADIAEDARFEAQASGREVSFRGEGEALAEVLAEPLHRAFENVIRNAVKFTPEGTAVEVEVRVLTAAGRFVLTVADRGPGVVPSDLERIFEPFFHGANQGAGTGLGLAIARRAVEVHGGSIRATNREGGGLEVEIVLPLG